MSFKCYKHFHASVKFIGHFCLLIFSITVASEVLADTLKLKLWEKKRGDAEIPVELILPEAPIKTPVPLVVLQHGSVRDAGKVFGSIVETDEHQRRLAEAALAEGFAVAIVDAFHGTKIKSHQKTEFPDAHEYARSIANYLASDTRLDADNFFYSGFSYGGRSVLLLMGDLYFGDGKQWAGLVAAEPGCATFHEARDFGVPLLTIKGAESHYEPLPCETMTRLYLEAGANVELVIYPKSNHYFSHNGEIVPGRAFNGCGDNPLIVTKEGKYMFLDGTFPTRKIVRKKCFTNRAGKGRSREDLDDVIQLSVRFFMKNLK